VKTRIHGLYELGQSVWCDDISRGMLESGGLRRLIDQGVVGLTSNPTIFMKAITGGSDYDARLHEAVSAFDDPGKVYEALVLADIADAADLLRPVYDRTDGVDGFVSLEVDPELAYDTQRTVREARRLFEALDRPNVFIKVPATNEGIPAVETLIGEGIPVNVTLIFAQEVHERVMEAYLAGLQRLDARGGDLRRVSSVASFFVSRVDTLVDALLEERRGLGADVDALLGRAANANARQAYARFEDVFGRGSVTADGRVHVEPPRGSPFARLLEHGARVQRPLWASTSTKNPAYPDTLYVDELVGPNTVNTMPQGTLQAVLDHGRTDVTIRQNLDEAEELFERLAGLGIRMTAVTERLRTEGVEAFAESHRRLMRDLGAKTQRLTASRAD
jgi:transaldolase/glucose-6-phosphate isomerase